ncbi:leucine zipper putative tumor suppressor 2 homolog [Erpetoichthys calabaricus]|uniref:Leucine zipper putative tumor suppressor 2 homolog n=1 Tax=Erpetoichthys calabaricus TaxID=27687 RepID=A0A8C4RLN7_ERPCA|nr:leucine zipper putative tumor suppressor 2 homolog [Erpetoichthys calabaricus]XP_028651585.1 leucine zipper putative tumor suppressor 2 homolog [Erpetoichthys calabaricus]XP_051778411.1 leucine zipper putative tumor suppressor 2 homolog [Erpetoichthys calabaricus]
MALVQTLPVPTDHQNTGVEVQHPAVPRSPPSLSAMGSVSSLISGRTYQERQCRASEVTAKCRKPAVGSGSFRQQDGQLRNSSSQEALVNSLPNRKSSSVTGANGNYAYLNEEFVGDWNDNNVTPNSPCSEPEELREDRTINGNIGGPPPKLVPVSGKLEKNIEKTLIRPTAFKPVVPKNRNSVQFLSPRPGCSGGGSAGSLSESQGSLNLLLPVGGSVACGDKRNSYSGVRNGSSHSGTMSDSGRNSLSSLPTYSTGCSLSQADGTSAHLDPSRGASVHGHSNSDSGRSSSSKSTGSLNGRGQPLSDNGSCGRSPAPAEVEEGMIRELEEKLRERELELQQLRDNLDENEAAICQVYEEKQKRCEMELEDLRQSCSSKLKQASQKAQRAQQVLQLQVFQLQQEKKKLQEDFSQLLQERELLEKKCASIEREQTELGPRLEETKWEVCQKSGEISLLKQQLKDLQADVSQKAGDIVSLKAQLREARSELQASQLHIQDLHTANRTRTLELEVCENELQRRKSEAELLREKVGRLEEEATHLRELLNAPTGPNLTMGATPSGHCPGQPSVTSRNLCLSAPVGSGYREDDPFLAYESDEAKAQRQNADTLQSMKHQVERLRAELMYERRRSEDQSESFEEERRVWHEEKEKVIRYQKQLQQNYIQMYRRNRELERAMRELSLELESRELEDFEVHGSEIHFEEITATEI